MIQKLLISVMGADAASASGMMGGSVSYSQMSSMMGMGGMTLWQEMLPGKDGAPVNELITRQYELIYGAWPAGYDQVVLVVDENNELDDMTLYALGLIPEEEMQAIANGEEPGEDWQERWTYEEICAQDYRVILPSACYSYDEATGLYSDLRQTDAGLQYLYDNALRLQVTGIIRKNPDVDTGMLSGKICYTSGLIDYMVEQAEGSEVVAAQKASPSRDVLTGLPFASRADSLTKAEKEQELRAYIDSLDQAGQAEVYVQIMSLPDEELIGGQVDGMLDEMSREDMVSTLSAVLTQQMSVSQDQIDSYLDEMSDEDLRSTFSQLLAAQMEGQYAQQAAAQLALLPDAQKANALALAMDGYTPDQWAEYYEVVMDFSESTYEDNLAAMGSIDLDSPAAINLYAASFNSKDTIEEVIAAYNAARDELHQISYTDYVGLLMSTVTSIINAITYVLVAFVAISLGHFAGGVLHHDRGHHPDLGAGADPRDRHPAGHRCLEAGRLGHVQRRDGHHRLFVGSDRRGGHLFALLPHQRGDAVPQRHPQHLCCAAAAGGRHSGGHQRPADTDLGPDPLPQRGQERPGGGTAERIRAPNKT